MIRVAVVDDHAIVRNGLVQLLSADAELEVVGAVGDGGAGVLLCAAKRPDVVLMDLSMPGMDGVEATRRIIEASPGVQVVVLTSFVDRERVLATIDAGAIGYLLKDAEPDEVIRGIRAAARGESPLAPKAARELLTARGQRPELKLSEREQEVLGCVAKGLPNKLIAIRLGISEKTVKAHLTRIYQQIGVTDRTQAALWARERGL